MVRLTGVLTCSPKIVHRKPCTFRRCTNILWLCLAIFLSIFTVRLSTLNGNNGNSEPQINMELKNGDQLSNHMKKPEHNRDLNNVKEKQKEKRTKPIGPGIIIKHQGDINSVSLRRSGIIKQQGDIHVQPISSGIFEKQLSGNTKQRNGSDIVKEQPGNKITQETNNKASVYTFSGGSWQLSHACKPYQAYLGNINFHLATSLSSAGSVQMFVHNPRKDAISSTILKQHSFEPELVDFAMFLLRKDPKLSLIDIGTNVGLFTMAGALLGRRVLAVDAVVDNIQHVCASVEYQKFTDRVFLINNAFSDSHGKVSIKMGGIGDFGLSHINEVDINSKMDKKFTNYFKNSRFVSVDAVTLDDVLNFPHLSVFENIFIKMDVEGNEHRVLLGAKEFMKKKMKSVKGILMEWEWVSGGQSEFIILNLMADWRYDPHRCNTRLDSLSTNNMEIWPKNVLWLPIDTEWTT